ncbi:MAG: hypothetical protein J6T35_08800 [Bacteroidales bacterium]|nr:hypothetical protein [Bacteroidales bacterium]
MKLYNNSDIEIFEKGPKYLTSTIAEIAHLAHTNVVEASKSLLIELEASGVIREDLIGGKSIHYNLRPGALVRDIARAFVKFLGTRSISGELFDKMLSLTVYGDGDCAECGGDLEYYGPLSEGDGSDYVSYGGIYVCKECGHCFVLDNNDKIVASASSYDNLMDSYSKPF